MSHPHPGALPPAGARPADLPEFGAVPSDAPHPDAPLPERHPDSEDRTRSKVLSSVLEHGPVSAAELGERLGFTPAAVRRHLDALARKQLIEVKLVSNPSSGAGRPARRYVLSQRGQTSLGTDYLSIATAALSQLQQVAGPDAVEQFARTRFAEMESRYAPLVEAAGPELEDRARALAAALSSDGFVGSTTVVGRNAPNTAMLAVQLCQGHCPVQELASEFPAFCDQETEVFARLLGVDVRRLSTLARGGHVCTTHIPVGRVKPPASTGAVPPSTSSSSRDTPHFSPQTVSIHQQERP